MTPRMTKSFAVLISFLIVHSAAGLPRAEANFWAERKKNIPQQRPESPKAPLLMAALPKSMNAPAADLLRQFPGLDRRPLTPALPENASSLRPSAASGGTSAILNALPFSYGTVRKVGVPSSGGPGRTIIHIQDVHANAEAQRNIGRAVQSLMEREKIDLVALEGAFEPVPLRPFRAYGSQDKVRRVADYLLRKNKITGPVHAGMTGGDGVLPFIGIDHPQHYGANVEAYRRAALRQDDYARWAARLKSRLLQEKTAAFNPALRHFDARVEAYREGKISLGEYIRSFVGAAGPAGPHTAAFLSALRQEETLDFVQVEKERARLLERLVAKLDKGQIADLLNHSAAYRMGRISQAAFWEYLQTLCRRSHVDLAGLPAMDAYVRYVLLAESIDAEALQEEMGRLERAGYDVLARTAPEKELAARAKHLYLVGKLIDFTLTPKEWEEYKRMGAPSSSEVDLSSFEAFYREAEARDRAMAQNLLAAMDARRAKTAVLVTGGFHAAGMDRLLRRSGATTIAFVPKITRVDAKDGAQYLSVFSQEKTPLEKLFRGEKLFLAQPPADNLAQTGAVLLAAQEVWTEKDARAVDSAISLALRQVAPAISRRVAVSEVETDEEGVRFTLTFLNDAGQTELGRVRMNVKLAADGTIREVNESPVGAPGSLRATAFRGALSMSKSTPRLVGRAIPHAEWLLWLGKASALGASDQARADRAALVNAYRGAPAQAIQKLIEFEVMAYLHQQFGGAAAKAFRRFYNRPAWSLPASGGGVVLDDGNLVNLADADRLTGDLHRHPLPAKGKLAVLERKTGEADVYAGDLIAALDKKGWEVRPVPFTPGMSLRGALGGFVPDLLLSPDGIDPAPLTTYAEELPVERGGLNVLHYPVFPGERGDLPFNWYFEFDETLRTRQVKAVEAFTEEVKRTPYQHMTYHVAEYYGSLNNRWAGEAARLPFASPFVVTQAAGERGEIPFDPAAGFLVDAEDAANKTVVFISPHSDDAEIPAGALMRRLLEQGYNVENWIVSLPPDAAERTRRIGEAEAAAAVLSEDLPAGAGTIRVRPLGLTKQDLAGRLSAQTPDFAEFNGYLSEILGTRALAAVVLPHAQDQHPTHRDAQEYATRFFLQQTSEQNSLSGRTLPFVRYLAPWAGQYDTYFAAEPADDAGNDRRRIANSLRRAYGRGGLVGELARSFGGAGLPVPGAERYRRETLPAGGKTAAVQEEKRARSLLNEVKNGVLQLVESFSGIRAFFGGGPGVSKLARAVTAAYAYNYAKQTVELALSRNPGRRDFRFVIGGDPRPTSKTLTEIHWQAWQLAAQEMGVTIDVLDLGVVSTPLIESAVRTLNADGGVMLTGSHNPVDQNGFKYMTGAKEEEGSVNDGGELIPSARMEALIDKARASLMFMHDSWDALSSTLQLPAPEPEADILERREIIIQGYIQSLKDTFGLTEADMAHIRERNAGHRVVVDPNNGGAVGITRRVLEEFGFTVYEIHASHPGKPAHQIEPIGYALHDASMEMRARLAELALVHDFDADRGTTVIWKSDFSGRITLHPQDVSYLNVANMLAWVWTHQERYPELRNEHGGMKDWAIVVHDATSSRIQNICRTLGAKMGINIKVVEAEVGEINVVTRMRELEREGYFVPAGLEAYNAGTVLRGSYVRDGAATALLSLLAITQPSGFHWLYHALNDRPWPAGQGFGPLDILMSLPIYHTEQQKLGEGEKTVLTQEEIKIGLEKAFLTRIRRDLDAPGKFSVEGLGEREFTEYRFLNYEETSVRQGRGNRATQTGGFKIQLTDAQGRLHFMWFRGSKTEAGVLRAGADSPDRQTAAALSLLQQELYREALRAGEPAASQPRPKLRMGRQRLPTGPPSPGIQVSISDEAEAAAEIAAQEIADGINAWRADPKGKKHYVLGLATGGTQIPLYKKLIKMVEDGRLSFKGVVTFNLDEYTGLPGTHDQSYRFYMWDNLFGSLFDLNDIDDERIIHVLNGTAADVEAEVLSYEEAMVRFGGVDHQHLGIGRDGHMAFMEPVVPVNADFLRRLDGQDPDALRMVRDFNEFVLGDDVSAEQAMGAILSARDEARSTEELLAHFRSERPDMLEKQGLDSLIAKIQKQKPIFYADHPERIPADPAYLLEHTGNIAHGRTREVAIALPTVIDNSRFFLHDLSEMPVTALSMGIRTILDAKKITLLATGDYTADAIYKALRGPISTMVSSSYLQTHGNVHFILTRAAASLLTEADLAGLNQTRTPLATKEADTPGFRKAFPSLKSVLFDGNERLVSILQAKRKGGRVETPLLGALFSTFLNVFLQTIALAAGLLAVGFLGLPDVLFQVLLFEPGTVLFISGYHNVETAPLIVGFIFAMIHSLWSLRRNGFRVKSVAEFFWWWAGGYFWTALISSPLGFLASLAAHWAINFMLAGFRALDYRFLRALPFQGPEMRAADDAEKWGGVLADALRPDAEPDRIAAALNDLLGPARKLDVNDVLGDRGRLYGTSGVTMSPQTAARWSVIHELSNELAIRGSEFAAAVAAAVRSALRQELTPRGFIRHATETNTTVAEFEPKEGANVVVYDPEFIDEKSLIQLSRSVQGKDRAYLVILTENERTLDNVRPRLAGRVDIIETAALRRAPEEEGGLYRLDVAAAAEDLAAGDITAAAQVLVPATVNLIGLTDDGILNEDNVWLVNRRLQILLLPTLQKASEWLKDLHNVAETFA